MDKIINGVIFDSNMSDLINQKLSSPTFTHKNWSDDDLADLRSYIRAHYRKEQQGLCAYCRNGLSLQSASNCHVEHIAPKSKYHKFIFEPKNLCVTCADCNEIKKEQETLNEEPDPINNGQKRSRYPRSPNAFKIVHPHFDIYEEHIEIFNGLYVDKSMKGHFTIGACRLNRKLHCLGWEQEIISEPRISDLMNSFLNSNDTIEKASYLDKLKQELLKLK